MALLRIQPHSAEWHAIRARHVGASEVPALLGAQAAYAMTPYTLHQVKAGKVPPPPVEGERIEVGLAMEPVIAALAAKRMGWTIRPGRYATDDACPGLGASLDAEIDPPATMPPGLEGCTGPGVLECKSVDAYVFKVAWTQHEPPPWVLIQNQAQLAASGFQWGSIAALVGGNALHLFHYRAREKSAAGIRARVALFWQAVRDGKPPPPDGSDGASHVIRSLFPELSYEPLDLRGDNELPSLCAEYQAASADEKEAKARREDLRNRIMAKCEGHRHAMVQGFNITISVTPAREPRPARLGEVISGKGEVRKLLVNERAIVGADA